MIAAPMRALFASKTAITAVLGSTPLRLYANALPQNPILPACYFREVSTVPTNEFSGASTFDYLSVDFFLITQSKADSESVGDTIRSQIENTSGTFSGIVINHILFIGDNSDYITDLKIYTRRIEFQFNVRR